MASGAYKIAVCDDNPADAEYVSGMVREWAGGASAQVRLFPSAESFLFCYAEEKDFDILLLDVEMGGMDGVSMARRVRAENEAVQIVFITGYSDYIADGYDVAALHYLLKPVKKERLFAVLDRAAERLKKNEKELLLKTAGETVVMPVGEIRWLDVQQNYVTVHGKTDVTVKRTLGELERELDERFFRVGRSCIVNLTCVRRVTKTDVYLTNGARLPLPRGQYDALNRAIIARM
ncbi:MAG: response regulator transcription factor [Oscillospiraceae bacterium]|nr:response regulator transcription factor [Oscillospiraceae bacterium]